MAFCCFFSVSCVFVANMSVNLDILLFNWPEPSINDSFGVEMSAVYFHKSCRLTWHICVCDFHMVHHVCGRLEDEPQTAISFGRERAVRMSNTYTINDKLGVSLIFI